MLILAIAGLLLSLLAVASPLHRPLRQLANPLLTNVTIKQLPWVQAAQVYRSTLLDWAVLLSAATITLEVYLTLLPLFMWTGKEDWVVTGFLPHLALSGYVVFAIKDLLESPRPGDCLKAAPDVHIVVRDPSGDIEDGVPSAHCCGAVSLLFYGINAAATAGVLPGFYKPLMLAAAAVWIVWLAWGRAYLGLHSPLDLATGCLLGWALLELWSYVEAPYAAWLTSAVMQKSVQQLVLQVLGVSALLMRCYPMPSRWTSCYNYATAWAAGWAGVTLGWAQHRRNTALVSAAAAAVRAEAAAAHAAVQQQGGDSSGAMWLFGGMVPAVVLKVLLGLLMVAATKVVVKAALLLVFKHVFMLVPMPVRCFWQPPVAGAAKQQQQLLHQTQPGVSGKQQAAQLAADTSPARDAAEKQQGQQLQQQPAVRLPQSKSGLCSTACGSSSNSSCSWLGSLRHTPDGLGNDVVAAARWGSYFAVGYGIMLWQSHWPQLLARLAYSTSMN